MITDGPFAEAKEHLAGYWIVQVDSEDEALEWVKQVPIPEGKIEVRQVMGYGTPIDLETFERLQPEANEELRKEVEKRQVGLVSISARPVRHRRNDQGGTMRYMLTLIGPEGGIEDVTPEQMNEEMSHWARFGQDAMEKGAFVAGEGAAGELDRDHPPGRPRQGVGDHRRSLRRVEGAARRLLPARVREPRRGHRVGEEGAAARGLDRGPAGDGLLRVRIRRPGRGRGDAAAS